MIYVYEVCISITCINWILVPGVCSMFHDGCMHFMLWQFYSLARLIFLSNSSDNPPTPIHKTNWDLRQQNVTYEAKHTHFCFCSIMVKISGIRPWWSSWPGHRYRPCDGCVLPGYYYWQSQPPPWCDRQTRTFCVHSGIILSRWSVMNWLGTGTSLRFAATVPSKPSPVGVWLWVVSIQPFVPSNSIPVVLTMDSK